MSSVYFDLDEEREFYAELAASQLREVFWAWYFTRDVAKLPELLYMEKSIVRRKLRELGIENSRVYTVLDRDEYYLEKLYAALRR